MLSEEVTEKLVERLVDRIETGNTYILKEIGKSINKIGTLSSVKAHELAQVLKYGGSYEKIVKKLIEITNLNIKEIDDIFKEVAKIDYEFAQDFYKYKNIKYVPYEKNTELIKQVNAIKKITMNEYANITRTSALGFGMINKDNQIVFKGLKKAYYDLIDEAVLNVSQGKETFNHAMQRQIKAMGGSGIKTIMPSTYMKKVVKEDGTIDYVETNRTMRLDTAIRQQMNSAITNLHTEIQKELGKQFDADGVEISVHLSPAPDHANVQGKQFTNKEFDNFQNDRTATSFDGEIFLPEHEGHDRRSIGKYNCYHYAFSVVLGVNKPQYSKEQLRDIIKKNENGFELDGQHYTMYEGTQLQRKLESAIRSQKDMQIMARESGLKDDVLLAQQNITYLNTKYKELCDASGLPRKADRLRVSGYKRMSVKN